MLLLLLFEKAWKWSHVISAALHVTGAPLQVIHLCFLAFNSNTIMGFYCPFASYCLPLSAEKAQNTISSSHAFIIRNNRKEQSTRVLEPLTVLISWYAKMFSTLLERVWLRKGYLALSAAVCVLATGSRRCLCCWSIKGCWLSTAWLDCSSTLSCVSPRGALWSYLIWADCVFVYSSCFDMLI